MVPTYDPQEMHLMNKMKGVDNDVEIWVKLYNYGNALNVTERNLVFPLIFFFQLIVKTKATS